MSLDQGVDTPEDFLRSELQAIQDSMDNLSYEYYLYVSFFLSSCLTGSHKEIPKKNSAMLFCI
jgi:hypothetical protein